MINKPDNRVAIMQPYFLPYIGYFQLLANVDQFVIYDNIEYTKKGWINRNRILVNGKDEYISLPLKKDSDYLSVIQRTLSDSFDIEKVKLLRKVKEIYKKAPYFEQTFPIFECIMACEENNLFLFILNSLAKICEFVDIKTELIISSNLSVDHSLKGQDKVIGICKSLKATHYVNPIGGVSLYDKNIFKEENITLEFLQPTMVEYKQFEHSFVPWLSILDVLMFNTKDQVLHILNQSYQLI